jgi:hypothetical protein
MESRRAVSKPTKKIELVPYETRIIDVAGPRTPIDF